MGPQPVTAGVTQVPREARGAGQQGVERPFESPGRLAAIIEPTEQRPGKLLERVDTPMRDVEMHPPLVPQWRYFPALRFASAVAGLALVGAMLIVLQGRVGPLIQRIVA